jgi:hypothetical protein
MFLSARGYLCGFNKPTDYERWLDWDHRKFTEFIAILFKLDKSMDLHAKIIKFNCGFNDKDHLGDIRNTFFEQKVLFELSQLLENGINPEHKTEAGQLELVRLIHRNLTPNNSIMLALNKVQPPAKIPKEFFAKFLRVRAENRAIWHSANDLGFFDPNSYGLSSNQTLSLQNNYSSQSASQQKRQKRDDNFREKKPLLSRPVGLVVLKAILELNATRVHIQIEIRRMCPSRRALLIRDGLQSSHQDLSAIQVAV